MERLAASSRRWKPSWLKERLKPAYEPVWRCHRNTCRSPNVVREGAHVSAFQDDCPDFRMAFHEMYGRFDNVNAGSLHVHGLEIVKDRV